MQMQMRQINKENIIKIYANICKKQTKKLPFKNFFFRCVFPYTFSQDKNIAYCFT